MDDNMSLPDHLIQDFDDVISYLCEVKNQLDEIGVIQTVTRLKHFFQSLRHLIIKQSLHHNEELLSERLDTILDHLTCFFASTIVSWVMPNTHEPSAHLLITFLKIIIKCFKSGVQLLHLMNHLKKTVNELCCKAKKARDVFLQEMSPPLWSLVFDKNSHKYLQLEVLVLLNKYTQNSSHVLRRKMVDKWDAEFLKFGQLINECGDHDLQTSIMEYIFRFYRSHGDIAYFGKSFIGHNDELLKVFTSIEMQSFLEHARPFLNQLNDQQGDTQCVFSVFGNKISSGNLGIEEGGHTVTNWIDFNLGTGNIVFEQSIRSPTYTESMTVYIYQEEVSVVVLTLVEDAPHIYRLTLMLNPTDLLPLNACHKLIYARPFNWKGDYIQMYINSSESNLQVLSDIVLPRLYGDRFKMPMTSNINPAMEAMLTPNGSPQLGSQSYASPANSYVTAYEDFLASLQVNFTDESYMPNNESKEAIFPYSSLHQDGLVMDNRMDNFDHTSMDSQVTTEERLNVVVSETESESESLVPMFCSSSTQKNPNHMNARMDLNKKAVSQYPVKDQNSEESLKLLVPVLTAIVEESVSWPSSTNSITAKKHQENAVASEDLSNVKENFNHYSSIEVHPYKQLSCKNTADFVPGTGIATKCIPINDNALLEDIHVNAPSVPILSAKNIRKDHIDLATFGVSDKQTLSVRAEMGQSKSLSRNRAPKVFNESIENISVFSAKPQCMIPTKMDNINPPNNTSASTKQRRAVFGTSISKEKEPNDVFCANREVQGGNKDGKGSPKTAKKLIESKDCCDELANKTLDIFASESTQDFLPRNDITTCTRKVADCLHSTDSKVETVCQKQVQKTAVLKEVAVEKADKEIDATLKLVLREPKYQQTIDTPELNLTKPIGAVLTPQKSIHFGSTNDMAHVLKTPQNIKRKLFTQPDDVIQTDINVEMHRLIQDRIGVLSPAKRTKPTNHKDKQRSERKRKGKAVSRITAEQSRQEKSAEPSEKHPIISPDKMDDFDRMCLTTYKAVNKPYKNLSISSKSGVKSYDSEEELETPPKKSKPASKAKKIKIQRQATNDSRLGSKCSSEKPVSSNVQKIKESRSNTMEDEQIANALAYDPIDILRSQLDSGDELTPPKMAKMDFDGIDITCDKSHVPLNGNGSFCASTIEARSVDDNDLDQHHMITDLSMKHQAAQKAEQVLRVIRSEFKLAETDNLAGSMKDMYSEVNHISNLVMKNESKLRLFKKIILHYHQLKKIIADQMAIIKTSANTIDDKIKSIDETYGALGEDHKAIAKDAWLQLHSQIYALFQLPIFSKHGAD